MPTTSTPGQPRSIARAQASSGSPPRSVSRWILTAALPSPVSSDPDCGGSPGSEKKVQQDRQYNGGYDAGGQRKQEHHLASPEGEVARQVEASQQHHHHADNQERKAEKHDQPASLQHSTTIPGTGRHASRAPRDQV